MITVGSTIINNKFSVWVSESSHADYYDCLILEKKGDDTYYVNLHKDSRFSMVEFKYPPKPLKVKKKNEEEEEVVPETNEEQIYRIEHSSYSARKDMAQPIWLLHSNSLEKVLQSISELK